MKLASFDGGQGPQTGIVVKDNVIPTNVPGTMIDLIANWETIANDIQRASGKPIPLADVQLLAPVQRPGKVYAIGLNYADHIAESNMETPEKQIWFSKAVTSVNAPHGSIEVPSLPSFVDYEAELVAVIGKKGRKISRENAAEHIFGYCVGNDVTERMWQHQGPQWSLGKSFDTHAPIGPWITTSDEVGDPHTLSVRCFVNGEKRQDSNTEHLVFNIWEQIEHLSHGMTLEPGDLIFTGTPSGIGAVMKPPVFLQPGDVLRTEIDRLGEIEGTMIEV